MANGKWIMAKGPDAVGTPHATPTRGKRQRSLDKLGMTDRRGKSTGDPVHDTRAGGGNGPDAVGTPHATPALVEEGAEDHEQAGGQGGETGELDDPFGFGQEFFQGDQCGDNRHHGQVHRSQNEQGQHGARATYGAGRALAESVPPSGLRCSMD